jgi:hypothetical protein
MKLNHKKILDQVMKRYKGNVNAVVREFMRIDNRSGRKPTRPSKHIGVEIECFGPNDELTLQKMVLSAELGDVIQVGYDHSIRTPSKMHAYELRILLSENRVGATFKKLAKFFKDAKLRTNTSCGLHVHLDMRRRDPEQCFRKLLKMQDVLYSLVNKNRWENRFCQPAAQSMKWDKYRAISMSSLRSKRTIEVRLHQGTVNVQQIEGWVKLLVNIINAPEVSKTPKSLEDVLKLKSLKRTVKPYLKKTLKDDWFKYQVEQAAIEERQRAQYAVHHRVWRTNETA